jgi:hypothetical protein
MKKLFLCFFIVAIVFICAVAEGADWILLGESNVGTAYYDSANIKKLSDKVIRVSVKYAYSSEGVKEFMEEFPKVNRSEIVGYTLYVYDINCSADSFRLTKAATYNSAGNVIRGTELEFSEAEQSTSEHITPNSMMEHLSRASCR